MPDIADMPARVEVKTRVRVIDGRDRDIVDVTTSSYQEVDASGLRRQTQRALDDAGGRATAAVEAAI
jgi:hypothetical protein